MVSGSYLVVRLVKKKEKQCDFNIIFSRRERPFGTRASERSILESANARLGQPSRRPITAISTVISYQRDAIANCTDTPRRAPFEGPGNDVIAPLNAAFIAANSLCISICFISSGGF